MDQRVVVVRDVGRPQVATACTRPTRAAGSCSACCGGRRARMRRGERLRVHRAPARQLPAGRAARPRARPRVPPGRGPAPLRRPARSTGRAQSCASCSASRRRAPRSCCGGGGPAARIGGRLGRAVALFAPRRPRGARRARGGRDGTLHAAASAVARAARPGGGVRPRAMSDRRAGVCGGRAGHARAREELRVRDHGAAARRSGARSPRSTRSRARSTTSRTATLPLDEKRARLEALRRGARRSAAGCDARRAGRCARPLPRSRAMRSPRSSTAGCRTPSDPLRELRRAARVLRARSRAPSASHASPSTDPATPSVHETLGVALQLINIMRDVRRGLAARPRLPAAGRARPLRRPRGRHRRRPVRSGVTLMAFQAARARAHLDEGLRLLDSLDRRSALCVSTFAGLYAGSSTAWRRNGFDVFVRVVPAVDAGEARASSRAGSCDEGRPSSAAGSRGSRRRSTSSTRARG